MPSNNPNKIKAGDIVFPADGEVNGESNVRYFSAIVKSTSDPLRVVSVREYHDELHVNVVKPNGDPSHILGGLIERVRKDPFVARLDEIFEENK